MVFVNSTAKFGTLGLFKADQIPDIKAIVVEKPGLDVACGAIGIGKKQTPQAKVCGVCQFFIGACLKTGGMPRPHSNSFLILFSFKKKETAAPAGFFS